MPLPGERPAPFPCPTPNLAAAKLRRVPIREQVAERRLAGLEQVGSSSVASCAHLAFRSQVDVGRRQLIFKHHRLSAIISSSSLTGSATVSVKAASDMPKTP